MQRPYRTDRDGSLVYFIGGPEDDDPIKIGITTRDPLERLAEIQNGSAIPLAIRHTEPGGRVREKQLHDWLDHARLEGEWFRPAPELLDYIAVGGRSHRWAGRRPAGRAAARHSVNAARIAAEWGWQAVINILAGAWRIVTGLFLWALSPRARRRKKVRKHALIGAAMLLACATVYGYPPAPWQHTAYALIVLTATLIAGRK